MDSVYVLWFFTIGVSPFGNLRIEAYLQLPAAYRSLSRPSSAPDAKAFTLCSSSLELSYFPVLSSELLEFHKQIFLVVNSFCEKVLSFLLSESIVPPFGEIVFYPNWKDLLIFANLLVKSSCPLICSFLTLQSFFIRFSMNIGTDISSETSAGGLKWTRTTDLALIRRAL